MGADSTKISEAVAAEMVTVDRSQGEKREASQTEARPEATAVENNTEATDCGKEVDPS